MRENSRTKSADKTDETPAKKPDKKPDKKPAVKPVATQAETPQKTPEETPAETAPRRRQARGERRIAQLLSAAAGVFCRTGYAAASTNAIAREAGVSPGTLYQFFPNKEAIAIELGGQLLQRAHEAHGQAFLPANLDRPLPEMLDAVLDPVIAFNCENPAFWALMHGSGVPGIAQEHDELHVGMVTRVEELLHTCITRPGTGEPALPAALARPADPADPADPTDPADPADPTGPADLTHVAHMVLCIFKASLELILASEGAERAAYVAELKAVLLRYLEPLITTPLPH
ncbi:TetR/AcrR family transcriptional regulator [Streptomyces sp. NBC_00096]|uniref:TetR/AcrR family transcriptional regulator n=1 Tax=Streptomyces sp. NBC_00096 TaxID=2975650 RepID=UPI003250A6CC